MKKLILLVGPPSSGKAKLSQELSKVLNADVVAWKSVVKKAGENTAEIPNAKSKKLSDALLAEILLSKKGLIIVTGFGLHEREAVIISDWVADRSIELSAVARINCSLSSILELNPGVDSEQLKDNYYLWRENATAVDNKLSSLATSIFELDGDSAIHEMTTDFLIGYGSKIKPSKLYYRAASSNLKTDYGTFRIMAYQSKIDFTYHLALVKGTVTSGKGIITRVHSSCITGDIFHSRHCDCGQQLELAMRVIEMHDNGVILYLFQEGRGINIINKIKAYDLQAAGLDTVDANLALGLPSEMRQYDIVREILDDLGVLSIRLLTNNPDKSKKLRKLGISVESVIAHEIPYNETNEGYLKTKKNKMNHDLELK